METWVISVFIGNAIVWIAYNTVSYTSYIVGALSFTFMFYMLVLLLFFSKMKGLGFMNKSAKYETSNLSEKAASSHIEKLNQLMQEEELFKNPNLKLPDLAKRLNILPHQLSETVNAYLDKNFTLFVNEYRINAAKKLIEGNSPLNIESIGYECGFNSKASFNRIFKIQYLHVHV